MTRLAGVSQRDGRDPSPPPAQSQLLGEWISESQVHDGSAVPHWSVHGPDQRDRPSPPVPCRSGHRSRVTEGDPERRISWVLPCYLVCFFGSAAILGGTVEILDPRSNKTRSSEWNGQNMRARPASISAVGDRLDTWYPNRLTGDEVVGNHRSPKSLNTSCFGLPTASAICFIR